MAVSTGWAGCSSDRPGWVEAPRSQEEFSEIDASVDVDAGCTGVSCSRDLRSILSCDGQVVRTCPDDLACGGGECVDPCSAAATNEGSIGCSFAIPDTNRYDGDGRGSCAAFFIANNWNSPATVHVEFEGEDLPLDDAIWVPSVEDGVVKHTKLDGPIPPGGGAVIFLSNGENSGKGWTSCPRGVKPIFDHERSLYGKSGFGKATFASSDVPVAMYSMYPYGGAKSAVSSAMLLFPTTSFKKNYVAISAWGGKSDLFGRGSLPGSDKLVAGPYSTLQVVAIEDDTSVNFLPKFDVVGGNGIPPLARGELGTYKLKRGQLLQLSQDQDLTGSIIESDKPVGLFGGHGCLVAPSDVIACDVENSQIPPISAWGHEYAVLPAPNRRELATQGDSKLRDPSVVRLVGAVNGTELVYEPRRPEGAPDTLQSGQLARFFAHEPFVVRSQDSAHPLYASVVMTGADALGNNTLGDPEMSMAVPTDQWLDSYVFFSDYQYQLSSAFVTRRKVGGTFHDVNLDCAGALTGWKRITDDYEWTFVELTRFGKAQTYSGGSCTDGAHRMDSSGPFTLSVWGLDYYVSYAYPGGAGLRPLTEVNVSVH
ncbi:MAG: hypothetical protein BGO98_28760 [Myxococcales bacterium 68-20]|nr:MAG: hypothetical protein BGO98_28760 [Myxococcales bacterium 68-20]